MSELLTTLLQYDPPIPGATDLFHACRDYIGDDRLFYVAGLAASHSIAFYGTNAFYGMFTRLKGPSQVEDYRFQPNRHAPADLITKCIIYVTCWHLIAPVLPYFLWQYAEGFHPTMMTDALPGVFQLLASLAVNYLLTDFWFYWFHRLLHWGPFYRYIHKQHHQFYVSIGFAAEYAHPVELLVGNVFPVVFGPVFLKQHFFTFVVWNFVALMGTTIGHSGVSNKMDPALSSEKDGFHDFHHSNNTGNFGSLPYWDWICGTDKAWRKHLAERGEIRKKMLAKKRG